LPVELPQVSNRQIEPEARSCRPLDRDRLDHRLDQRLALPRVELAEVVAEPGEVAGDCFRRNPVEIGVR
jgi:hypothetical protein